MQWYLKNKKNLRHFDRRGAEGRSSGRLWRRQTKGLRSKLTFVLSYSGIIYTQGCKIIRIDFTRQIWQPNVVLPSSMAIPQRKTWVCTFYYGYIYSSENNMKCELSFKSTILDRTSATLPRLLITWQISVILSQMLIALSQNMVKTSIIVLRGAK
jgi:hypothetical protein